MTKEEIIKEIKTIIESNYEEGSSAFVYKNEIIVDVFEIIDLTLNVCFIYKDKVECKIKDKFNNEKGGNFYVCYEKIKHEVLFEILNYLKGNNEFN